MNDKLLPLENFIEKTKEEGKIPDKLYFRISEVSKLTSLEPYVLRYWESEFKVIKPIRTKSRHRLYRRKDLEILFEIKKLLYEEQYTIAGAKKRLEEIAREEKKDLEAIPDENDYKKILHATLKELKALRKLLTNK
ncbi:MAG: MerR family transcriptional regulator [Thermodesulfobacteriota bacterium]|jgi:DNA-binding transcriptional MerR regulator|nr:MAG: MerR family transcriptional regulator [Thermodesulfobacteriota bacterium]